MRRKAPEYFVGWQEYELLADFDPRRLQMIGAIALQWNYIEDILDGCLGLGLQLDFDISVDVTSRINGMDGKTEILHRIIRAMPITVLTDSEKTMVKVTVDAVSEYKKYRDGIIHARIAGSKDDIAISAPNRGGAFQIIVATAVLETVYTRLEILGHEIVGLWRLLEHTMFREWDLIPDGNVDPQKLRTSEIFPSRNASNPRTSEAEAIPSAASTILGQTPNSSKVGSAKIASALVSHVRSSHKGFILMTHPVCLCSVAIPSGYFQHIVVNRFLLPIYRR